jgi:hypothetical protein
MERWKRRSFTGARTIRSLLAALHPSRDVPADRSIHPFLLRAA